MLSRAGHADRARHRRLYHGRSRRAAQGHGEEAERQDPGLPREIRRPAASPTASTRSSPRTSSPSSSRSRATASTSAHAAAYGWIAYQTAFLKANYPLQYFAALMSSVRDKTDKLVEYIDEAKKMGIAVLPPDVNESLADFAVVGSTDSLRLGRGQRRRRGRGRRDARPRANATAVSPISSISTKRVEPKAANRKVFEALIKCGALDTLPGNRARTARRARRARSTSPRANRAIASWARVSLFGMIEEARAGARADAARRCRRPRRWRRWRGRRRRWASSSRAIRWPTSPKRSRAAGAIADQGSARNSRTIRRSRIARLGDRACAGR